MGVRKAVITGVMAEIINRCPIGEAREAETPLEDPIPRGIRGEADGGLGGGVLGDEI